MPICAKSIFRILASTHISIILVLATRSSCTSPGTFEHETATVTCDFEKDIRNLGLDFELRHIPVTVSDTESEIVLSCYWEERKPVCRGRPGYQLGSDVTHQFIVKIFAVSHSHAGKYVCMLVPHDPGEYNYCQLVIKETTTQEITTNLNKAERFDIGLQSKHLVVDSNFSTLGKQVSTLRSPTSTPDSDILTKDTKGTSNVLLALVIILVVLVIGLMITVIWWIRSRHGNIVIIYSKEEQKKQKDSSKMLLEERNDSVLLMTSCQQPSVHASNKGCISELTLRMDSAGNHNEKREKFS